MSRLTWPELIAAAPTNGTAVTGTSAASLLPPTALHTFAPNALKVGDRFRLWACGRISNIITTPGSLTVELRLAGVAAFTTGAIPLNIVAKTNVSWLLEADIRVDTVGSGTGATAFGFGRFTSESVIGSPLPSVGGSGVLLLPSGSPGVGTGFDSTANVATDLFAQFSLTGNSVRLDDYMLHGIN